MRRRACSAIALPDSPRLAHKLVSDPFAPFTIFFNAFITRVAGNKYRLGAIIYAS
jgi:hypothetical protein